MLRCMNDLTKNLLNGRLKGGALEVAIIQSRLPQRFAGVARSAGFGTAVEQARAAKRDARSAAKAQRASRRRNR